MRAAIWTRALAAAAATVLLGSACGGDNSSSSAPTAAAPSTTLAGSTSSAGGDANEGVAPTATSAAGKPATGEPIKVLQIVLDSPDLGISLPNAQASLRGRLDRLNQQGGVLGRPVQVDVCQAGFDPNKAAACAQKAVEGHYLAAVGGNFAAGGDYHAILAAAKIPEFGYAPYDPKDGAAANAFLLSYGGPGVSAADVRRVIDEFKPKTVAVMYTDSAGGATSLQVSKQILEPAHITVQPVPIPRNQPDLSAVIQTAMRADAIAMLGTGADLAKIVTGLKQAGYEKFVIPAASVLPPLAKAMGSILDGVKGVTNWSPASMNQAGYQQYVADLAAADKSQPTDDLSLESWAAGDLFATAAAKLTTVDSAELLKAGAAITSYDGGGTMTPIDFSKPGTVVPDQPAVRRTTAIRCTFKNQVCAADAPAKWIDSFSS